jgi:hypothetical protein
MAPESLRISLQVACAGHKTNGEAQSGNSKWRDCWQGQRKNEFSFVPARKVWPRNCCIFYANSNANGNENWTLWAAELEQLVLKPLIL